MSNSPNKQTLSPPQISNEKKAQEERRNRFLIESYFKQVHQGCNENILHHSIYCCHNPSFQRIDDPNEAAVAAFKFTKKFQESYLCSYLTTTKEKIDFKGLEKIVDSAVLNGNIRSIENMINERFSLPMSIINNFQQAPIGNDSQDSFQGLNVADSLKLFNMLMCLNNSEINSSMTRAFTQLSNNLKYNAMTYSNNNDLIPFIFLLTNPFVHELDNRGILANVCSGIFKLNQKLLNRIETWFSCLPKDSFNQLLVNFEQFISVRILIDRVELNTKDEPIIGACGLIQLLYNVNEKKDYVEYTEFYNDAINNNIDLYIDFPNWTKKTDFSFTTYPCILNLQIKSMYLQIEYTLTQKNNRSFLGSVGITTAADFLVFKLNRENLVNETIYTIDNIKKIYPPSEFKKELKVQFIGEEGIDQGGVKQEFFQLIVRKIFDPEFGMFKYNDDTRCYWFRSDSQDYIEFELIGIILGLALYNSIILDVHFPLAIFSKLLGKQSKFEDLKSIDPMTYNTLVKLRDTEDDVSDWGLTYSVTEESFGETVNVDLVKGGSEISVTNENKKDFIEKYEKYLLTDSISKQWRSFYKGFNLICDSPVLNLLRPEELESFICGVEDLNFAELEKVTKYDGGYTKNDTTIKNFWRALSELSIEDKKRFLSFTTGSDRVPFGGLSKLDFYITKTADSDRLPSAHTCFNTIILPAYPTYEKLKALLTKAITHCEGFGLR